MLKKSIYFIDKKSVDERSEGGAYRNTTTHIHSPNVTYEQHNAIKNHTAKKPLFTYGVVIHTYITKKQLLAHKKSALSALSLTHYTHKTYSNQLKIGAKKRATHTILLV